MPNLRRRKKPIQIDNDTSQMREFGLSRIAPPHLDGMGDHFLDPSHRRGHVWWPGWFVEAPGYRLDGAREVLVGGHPIVDEFDVGYGGLRKECRAVGFGMDGVTVFVYGI